MARSSNDKLFLGPRVRVLRRELGLNQAQMAEELGISPSYLNHLERNQRPLTTSLLLRLAETYDIDIRDFVAGARKAAAGDLHEIFSDPLVRDLGTPKHEISEVAENYPNVAEAMARLFRALSDLREEPGRLQSASATGSKLSSPLSWLRDLLDSRNNHFPEIDAEAEALSTTLGEGPEVLYAALVRRLDELHGIQVRVVPQAQSPGALRHYDVHRKRLILCEILPPASRLFGVAYQAAFQDLGEVVAAAVERAEPAGKEARVLARIALTGYAAAALVMPYARFHAAAEASRYDLDLLCARFGASYEQVAHRITTLSRQGARGVPFFMLKLDVAGNVSKRFAAEALPLARFGGGCPRWRVHRALRRPDDTVADFVETPDGRAYVTFGHAVSRLGTKEPTLIVLGCEAKHARRVAYADLAVQTSPTLVGPACHVCERVDCPDRSLPPISRTLNLHQNQRPTAPYPFNATEGVVAVRRREPVADSG